MMTKAQYMRGMMTIALCVGFAQGTGPLAHAEDDKASRVNLENAVKRLFETEKPTVSSFEDSQGKCITVPTYPEPDARSKSSKPFAWHIDFLDRPEVPLERARQLKQLNALVEAGLLSKAPIEAGAMKAKGVRYGVTEKGWASMMGATTIAHPQYCFAYGRVHVLAVTRADKQNLRTDDRLDVYTVHAKVGMRGEAELAPWARDKVVQAAFPEIRRDVEGEDMTALFVRDGDDWVPYQSMLDLEQDLLRERQRPIDSVKPRRGDQKSSTEDNLRTLKSLPAPTEEEVKELIRKHHGVRPQHPLTQWPIPCVHLPGSEKLPVDKSLNTTDPPRYAVAIYSNKERSTHDRVAQKTMPYLEQLERLGILTKRPVNNMAGEGKDSNKAYDGYLYELVPQYQGKIHSRYHCFHLGAPTVKFVTLTIRETQEYPLTSFAYRIKVLYADPPAWGNDPVLNKWSEFRGALDNGFACEGKFEFDRKSRDQMSGTGGCWWAFDSYYEFQ